MRRFRSRAENVMSHPGQAVPALSGKPAQAESGQRVPTQLKQRLPSKSGQPVPSKSGQHVPSKSRQHVPSKSGQCGPTKSGQQHFRAHSQSGPGQWRIRVPYESGLHSPTQSSTPNESLHLTAQSRQHTPEPQSRRSSDAQSEPDEQTPALSHPSTLNVSSTAANDNLCWNIGFKQRDGRMRVQVIEKTLEPSNNCSARIQKIMYERLELEGYNWKSISEETQSFYFEEFKKYFVWRQSGTIIYDGWKDCVRKKYSELVSVAHSNWEKYNRRDKRIDKNVYLNWVEYWKTPKFQTKSIIQKKNHRSGVDGRPSTHTSGSASHRTVAARYKIQHKREPTADVLFYMTHTRNAKKNIPNGDIEDNGMDDEDGENGEEFEETFLVLCDQQEKFGEPVDRNALFLKAGGGPDKKNRVYGFGSSQSIFYKLKTMHYLSSFATEEENQQLKHQLTEMNERMKAMENQLAPIIEANPARLPRSPADLNG
ncbi:hypothetical protein AgCh_025181 [Apium graveolens]